MGGRTPPFGQPRTVTGELLSRLEQAFSDHARDDAAALGELRATPADIRLENAAQSVVLARVETTTKYLADQMSSRKSFAEAELAADGAVRRKLSDKVIMAILAGIGAGGGALLHWLTTR